MRKTTRDQPGRKRLKFNDGSEITYVLEGRIQIRIYSYQTFQTI